MRLGSGRTYVDTPELLDRVEGNNFLQKIIPVVALRPHKSVHEGALVGAAGCEAAYLAAGRLGEPQGPVVLERVLDVEVIFVIKDSHQAVVRIVCGNAILALVALGRDGDRLQVDLLRHGDGGVGWRSCVCESVRVSRVEDEGKPAGGDKSEGGR